MLPSHFNSRSRFRLNNSFPFPPIFFFSDICTSHSCTSKSTFLIIMGCSGNPALISCCLLFACLCLTKQFSPYVDALNVDLDVDCVPDISDMVDYDPVTQTSARCEKMKREKQKAKDQCQVRSRSDGMLTVSGLGSVS